MTERGFNQAQVEQLLKPINQSRVLSDGKGFSHVSQQDILAHLTRIFGFGNFDIDVKSVELVFENPRDEKHTRFDVCYKALVRLTIRDSQGNEICHFENGSMETSQNQTRGDGHDLAYKSAISPSVKRAAIALGDQFGLSLYNKGQMAALVRSTLIQPDFPTQVAPLNDIQEGIPQQVSLGNDEKPTEAEVVVKAPVSPVEVVKPVAQPVTPVEPQTASDDVLRVAHAIIGGASTLDTLRKVWADNKNWLDQQFDVTQDGVEGIRTTLAIEINDKKKEIEGSK